MSAGQAMSQVPAPQSGWSSDFERFLPPRQVVDPQGVILARHRVRPETSAGTFMASSMPPFGVALPREWPRRLRSAIIHAISLAHVAPAFPCERRPGAPGFGAIFLAGKTSGRLLRFPVRGEDELPFGGAPTMPSEPPVWQTV